MDKKTLYRLWSLTAGERPRFAAAIVAMALSSALFFSPPLISKYAIDAAIADDLTLGLPIVLHLAGGSSATFTGYLWITVAMTILLTVLAGGFLFLRERLTAIASQSIAENLRQQLYHRLHQAEATFFDNAQTGDLVQRCSTDVDSVRVFLDANVVEIFRSIVLLLTALPLLVWISPGLTLASLTLMPVYIVGSAVFFLRLRDLFQATDEAEGRLTSTLQENLTGIRVVRAFNRQAFEIEKFSACNEAYRDCNYRVMVMMSRFWSISDFLCISQVGIALIGGAQLVSKGSLTIGDLFAFTTYITMVIWPIRHLGRVLVDSGKALVAMRRIHFILDQPGESQEQTPGDERACGNVCVRNLSFAYAEQAPTLDGINLDIKAGQSLGLVGPPGCGKSTLVALLLRLYDYSSGSIKLDGRELSTVNRAWLRSQIAVVFQQPFLYSRSITGNLQVGHSEAGMERLQQVCKEAALHESIMKFSQQYNAKVGERGVTLSGGQRQRLALARALLKEAPILVLDDSLSAVDTETEKHILQALQQRSGQQTTLIIAHRLSSVRRADRIAVMEAGRIVQLGTHEALSQTTGPYQRLCQIQGELDASIEADIAAGNFAKSTESTPNPIARSNDERP